MLITIGHAIEALSAYAIPHGIGIAIGLLVENAMSVSQGILSKSSAQRIGKQAQKLIPDNSWLTFFNLPLQNLLPLLKNDKKAVGETLKLALLKQIGHITFVDLPLDEQGITVIQDAVNKNREKAQFSQYSCDLRSTLIKILFCRTYIV